MIKGMYASGQVEAKKPPGRPSKITKRCELAFSMACPHCFVVVFRYLNSLYRLANKHPFWGARKLSETLHADMMTALSDRPVGFRFRVRYLTHLELSLIMSSHVLQMPPTDSPSAAQAGLPQRDHCQEAAAVVGEPEEEEGVRPETPTTQLEQGDLHGREDFPRASRGPREV
jgi:hypothetical protein